MKNEIKGYTSAFSGNSGVGKSSITKLITADIAKEEKIEIGDIGIKSKRGKHTTKYVKLYSIDNDTYILDTPGFSSYELYDIKYDEIKNYYNEFKEFHCMYDDCNHVNEDISVCCIKKEVENGKIDKARYDRYVYIYEKLKDMYDRRYK